MPFFCALLLSLESSPNVISPLVTGGGPLLRAASLPGVSRPRGEPWLADSAPSGRQPRRAAARWAMNGLHLSHARRGASRHSLNGGACNHTPTRLLAAAPGLAACALPGPPRPPLPPVAETAATAREDGDDGARRTARPIRRMSTLVVPSECL